MKLTLKNDAGLVREVPTGLSWTGWFFTGFTMMTRCMIAKGLVYMLIIYSVQTMTVVAQWVVTAADGEKAGAAAGGVYLILLSIPNFIFLFKLNKWTARHWLGRGYKPQGPGWVQWGPKFGIQISEEVAAASVGIKNDPTVRAKDVIGFIFVAVSIFIVVGISFGGVQSEESVAGKISAQTEQHTQTPTKQYASLREVVKFDDSKWALLEVENLGAVLRSDSAESKHTNGRFIRVRFNVTNTTNEEETVVFTPTLRDGNGRVFQQMDGQEFYLREGAESMTLEQLPAGLKKTFQAIYEVPSDATGLCFQARSLADQGEIKRIATGL